jgi:CRP-like cAMP-binding protein
MSSSHELLRGVFSAMAELPDAEWAFVSRTLREMRFAPRAHLFREGEVPAFVHYIVSGLVRIYQNDDGRELVHGFDYEGRFIAPYESLITARPSGINVQAIEPTDTVAIPGPVLTSLYDRHPCWDRVGRKILEEMSVRRQDKEMRFRRYSPEAHYRLLIARRSPLIDRVPLRQLASYLGIAPETLSRIRRRQRDTATPGSLQA